MGCYDAKTIHFFPQKLKLYHGYDVANWKNGLELARAAWKDNPEYKFFECTKPEDIREPPNTFDVTVSMETLEHVPSALVERFVAKMADASRHACLITVPNEKGIIFFLKYIFKGPTSKRMAEYSLPEVFYASIGAMDKVKRVEGGHKGFDYVAVEQIARRYFRSVHLEGIQVGFLPAWLNVSVAIVCEK